MSPENNSFGLDLGDLDDLDSVMAEADIVAATDEQEAAVSGQEDTGLVIVPQRSPTRVYESLTQARARQERALQEHKEESRERLPKLIGEIAARDELAPTQSRSGYRISGEAGRKGSRRGL